jgi:hypothetical protein
MRQYDWSGVETSQRGEAIFEQITGLTRHPHRWYDFMGCDGQPISIKSAVFDERFPYFPVGDWRPGQYHYDLTWNQRHLPPAIFVLVAFHKRLLRHPFPGILEEGVDFFRSVPEVRLAPRGSEQCLH